MAPIWDEKVPVGHSVAVEPLGRHHVPARIARVGVRVRTDRALTVAVRVGIGLDSGLPDNSSTSSRRSQGILLRAEKHHLVSQMRW